MEPSNQGRAQYPRLPISERQIRREKRFAFWVITLALVAGIGVGSAFIIKPDLDFLLTDMLRTEDGFALSDVGFWSVSRRLVMWAYAAFYVIMVIGLVQSVRLKRMIWNLYPVQWFYLVMCSLAGPLLVSNLILKTYIGRPRPRSVTEYGGPLDFVPLFETGGKCVDNCSFVSGEVSSMVMIFASLMFVAISKRWLFTLLLFPAWAFSAVMRVGQGGHFPSDAYFAGIFMILIAAGLYRLIVLSPRNIELGSGPIN